jgi:amino acid adenylation domain-containing protein
METNLKAEHSEDVKTGQAQGFHLSPQQKRLWLLQQRDPIYLCQLAVMLEGPLDTELLQQALQDVIDRHEILRTTFKSMAGMRVPMQVIHEHFKASWRQVDLSQSESREKEARIDDILVEERRSAFDLNQGPLLRAILCVLSPQEHVLVITLSSLCADAATLDTLTAELTRAYSASPHACDPPQYADLAAWQNDLLDGAETEAGRAFWERQDFSAVESSRLPGMWVGREAGAGNAGGEEGEAARGFRPERVAVGGGAELKAEIERAGQREGVSAGAMMLACWEAVLWRMSGGVSPLAVGISLDGREDEELKEALGPLSKVVPIVTPVSGETNLAELAREAEARLREARAYADYFSWERTSSSSSSSSSSLSSSSSPSSLSSSSSATSSSSSLSATSTATSAARSCALHFQDSWSGSGLHHPASHVSRGVTFTLRRHWACGEPFQLKLRCGGRVVAAGEAAGEVVGEAAGAVASGAWAEVEYDAAQVSQWQARAVAQALEAVVREVAASGEGGGCAGLRVGEVEMLCGEARREVVEGWNETEREYGREETVHEMFAAQAWRRPEAVAVVSGEEEVRYGELEARAEELARRLRGMGVGVEEAVGLYVGRGVAMVVGMLGIMKAGGCYVPLDPENPKERVAGQVASVRARVLVTQETLLNQLPDVGCTVLCLDRESQTPDTEQEGGPKNFIAPQNPAYIIFTSGSSGTPKGVAVTHQSLANYARFICEKLQLTNAPSAEPLRFATVSTIAADLGNTCIFPSLISGGSLHILSYEVATDSVRFGRYIAEHSIDVLKIVPSHLSALLSAEDGSVPLPRRHLILGGEALSFDLLERLSKLSESCRVFNHYGPTETTVGSLTFNADGQKQDGLQSATVPIGKPIANTEVYILDDYQHPIPVGVPGELYIGGEGLARGYFNEPGLTAERFVPHPFSRRGGERLYKTGDLARYLPDGNVEFLGRVDHQVKIRGFRVELGEIESVLRGHPGVAAAVVIVRDDAPGDKRLTAYVVFRSAASLSTNELRAYLLEKLPEYMVPAAFVELHALPLTPNGKIDRRALPAPDWEHPHAAASFIAPDNPTERLLSEIWSKVLGVERVGVKDNFFELGGDSIMSIQIAARANREGLRLAPMDIFRHPTIAELSVTLSAASPLQDEPAPAPGRSQEARDYSPADFPQVQLDQQKLNSILERISGGGNGTD